MSETIMSNFTSIPNIVIMITSVIIGVIGVKHALSGVYSKLKWVILIVAIFFIISIMQNFERKLYLIPLAVALLAIFLVNLLVDMGVIRKRDKYEEITLEKAEEKFTKAPSASNAAAEKIQEEYEEALEEKKKSGLVEPEPEVVDAEVVEEEPKGSDAGDAKK